MKTCIITVPHYPFGGYSTTPTYGLHDLGKNYALAEFFSRYNSKPYLGIWGKGSIIQNQTGLTTKKCTALANFNKLLTEMDLNQNLDFNTA